jgi:serine phosphatase RsbU (regulator of sigma subunit)
LVAQIEKQKQVEASLHVAREVQRRFMPTRMPAITGYEAAAWWFPNQHVGGDYCDIWKMSDGTVGLCVADVSGHGLGPSLLMASVRASLRTLLLEHAAAASLLEMLGRALNDDLQHGAFVTMILAMLDPLTHRLEFANAGHGPAFVLRPTATAVTTLEATGGPLGVLEHPHYPTGPVQYLEVGDIVVFCTDGIVEATNCEGTQFGLARLERLVAELASRPIQEIAERIGTAVTEYNVEDSPEDDLTVLLVRRIG